MKKIKFSEYVKQIQDGFKWDRIVAEVEANRSEDRDSSDSEIGTCYLGSILSLTPSGKFYTPWANSNVERCGSCRGSGHIFPRSRRLRSKLTHRRNKLYRLMMRMRGDVQEDFDRYLTGKLPRFSARYRRLSAANERICNRLMATCLECDGVGSVEALNDQTWQEALEAVAGEHGLFITNGDGDGDSVYAAKSFPLDKE